MGSSLRKMMDLSVAVVFFLSAIWIAYHLFTDISSTLDAVNRSNARQDRALQTDLQVQEKIDTVSGAVVLQSIYQLPQTKVPITVDGVTYRYQFDPELQPDALAATTYHIDKKQPFQTDELTVFNIDALDVRSIDVRKLYKPRYIRDQDGTLTAVEYRSI